MQSAQHTKGGLPMLQCTQDFLNLVQSFSNIPRYQMPTACRRISEAVIPVMNTISGAFQLSDSERLSEHTIVYTTVNAFYLDVIQSCADYMIECNNLEANNTAAEWLLEAEALLIALQVIYKYIPNARHIAINAAKTHIQHLQTFSQCKARHIRKKQIAELGDFIRQYEPGFETPKVSTNWWPIIAVILTVVGIAVVLIAEFT